MSQFPIKDDDRGAELSALYRAAAADAPPPALDAAILAAAHREAGARPRSLGFSFRRTARAALSIAAVLVLSVSLVTLMREEAPDAVSPSPEQGAPAAANEKSLTAEGNTDTRDARRADVQTPKSIGLKPSNSSPSTGLAMPRGPDFGERYAQRPSDKLTAKVESRTADQGSSMKRRDQFASAPLLPRGNSDLRAPEPQRQPAAAKEESAPAPAAARPPLPAETAKNKAPQGAVLGKLAESKTSAKPADADREADTSTRALKKDSVGKQMADAAPAAPPVSQLASPEAARSRAEPSAEPTPEKWLERIEELRKQGKLDEARASLAEFKKRYPDYRLPESLRDGIR
ncbi:MAG: hypothetical protein JWN94_4454 [Betaproteobacteria bacterium]|nr:hypothetical protein [Betaproteobacteria bacterium]